jgi:hypothetical protein
MFSGFGGTKRSLWENEWITFAEMVYQNNFRQSGKLISR